MNSAPQVQTAEISDADLDNVSGGLSPQLGLTAGSVAVSSTDLLGQVDGVKTEAVSTVSAIHQVGITASF